MAGTEDFFTVREEGSEREISGRVIWPREEGRFGQIELARDELHLFCAEACGSTVDDGQRVTFVGVLEKTSTIANDTVEAIGRVWNN